MLDNFNSFSLGLLLSSGVVTTPRHPRTFREHIYCKRSLPSLPEKLPEGQDTAEAKSGFPEAVSGSFEATPGQVWPLTYFSIFSGFFGKQNSYKWLQGISMDPFQE